ncbi:putative eukaryotic translation initiation factor 5B [Mitosporidium daphniae]|uniref:Eukaryotic translation initiation factor 5B n=1 Tax=Mitosporidium daphniae TaxID=1485682 RepID=A0A098VVC8_9MICR|nr:putative eukaryotic translation initiation factor 5B [Mitosporidium daphniae]KGG52872.1 putative eukaryotic translation initiation factor 5B [Mitosporidium daphniae]|eukprot:XP_013239299.1 putative eukaryotic translation initiation factor 5B [Mitosporidium daphniae]
MDPDLEQYWNEYEAQVCSSSSKGKKNKKPQKEEPLEKIDGISKRKILAEDQNTSTNQTKLSGDSKKRSETKESSATKKESSATKKANSSKKSIDTKKGSSELEIIQETNTMAPKKSSSKKDEEEKKLEPSSSKKKPQNTAILAIKRMQEAMKAQEEELKKLEEEERQKEMDAQREAEEKRLAEEAERQPLKKEGTKAERERLKIDKEKITILQQQSINHHNLDNPSQDPAPAPERKKLVYTKKKASSKSSYACSQISSAHTSKLSTTDCVSDKGTISTDSGSSNEEILDSWEDALEDKDDDSNDSLITGLTALNCKDAWVANQPQISTSANASMNIPATMRRAPADHKSHVPSLTVKTSMPIDNSGNNEQLISVAPVEQDLMSPIICVLGHVDTGKTKLLDKLRETSVQENEAGGITQQIGATFFPREAIIAKMLITGSENEGLHVKIPGLVVIDTPGHASFANLRDRGSSLCHLAVLVVDIMHGLEPQTLESIELLRRRRTPFVVALNKIDRLYGWSPVPGARSWSEIEAAQKPSTVAEFRDRLDRTKLAFASQAGLNAELHQENTNPRSTISLIPISALTGEGIPDLLRTVVMLTQERLGAALVFDENRFSAFVLEVKSVEGLGHVIDVILTQGTLAEGDQFAVAGLSGPILSQVRSLLTPEPMKESRVKTLRYLHHTTVRACMGVRIVGLNLEAAVAGSRLVRVTKSDADEGDDDAATVAMRLVDEEMREVLGIKAALSSAADRCRSGAAGVSVQASTLGSLEALLTFLAANDVPVATASIGTIYKRDILTTAANLERWTTAGNPEARDYAAVLAFDVRVDREVRPAQELAEDLGIKIFSADIIYHLLDTFKAHRSVLVEQRKRDLAPQAVFPCVLKIVPGCVFNKRSPIILGVQVTEGVLRIGTPLVIHQGEGKPLSIGRVTSIELNHRPVDKIRRGGSSVAIKIEQASYEIPRMVGRHFSENDELLSAISRTSIDILKTSFREEMTAEDWQLIRRLKGLFGIQ